MRRSSLELRVITSSCAWRPEQHLGQAHGSVQLVLVLCKHRTLGGLAGTIFLVLPHPPSPQCCHSSSSICERPSCKRTRELSSPWHPPASWTAASHREADRPRCSLLFSAAIKEPSRAGEDISTANELPAVGRWGCSPVFNSKVTNRPNCCAVEQQLREPPRSTVAPRRSFPTKQRSDHSAWSSSAHRRRSRRTNQGTSSHRRYSENWRVHPPWAIMGTVRFLAASSVFVVGTTADHFRPTSKWESRSAVS